MWRNCGLTYGMLLMIVGLLAIAGGIAPESDTVRVCVAIFLGMVAMDFGWRWQLAINASKDIEARRKNRRRRQKNKI